MRDEEPTLHFYGGPYIALVPTLIFILLSGVFTIVFHYYSLKALTISAVIGLVIVFFMARNRKQYWNTIVSGLARFGNAKLIFVFLIIGVFTKLLLVGKVGQGFVWLSLMLGLHGAAFTILAFIGTAVFALGSGVPFAALFAALSIFYVPGILVGSNPAILAGAIIGGVYCGDALSPSSQLTNATLGLETNSTTGEPADLVKTLQQRIPWIAGAALITVILLGIFGGQGGTPHSSAALAKFSDPRGLWMLIPIIVVVLICIRTKEILTGLTWGVVVGTVVGLMTNLFQFKDVISIDPHNPTLLAGILFDGVYSMVDISLLTIFLYGLIAIMHASGVVDLICERITSHRFVRTARGAELTIAAGIGLVNILLSGCDLPGILLFGEMSDHIGHAAHISPERRTYLIITVATSFTGISPINSVYVMGVISVATQMHTKFPFLPVPTPTAIFGATFFSLILTILWLCWVLFGWGRTMEPEAQTTNAKVNSENISAV